MADAIDDDMRSEYDESVLKNGIRGKYASRYASGTNIIRIAPDVAEKFPNEDAVNEALRWVIRLAEDAGRLTSG